MGTPVEHGNWTTAIRYDRNGDSMASIAIPPDDSPQGHRSIEIISPLALQREQVYTRP